MFSDLEAVKELIKRLSERCGKPIDELVFGMFGRLPAGDEGLARFERLLRAVPSPGTLVSALEQSEAGYRLLGVVLATSDHLANIVIQNPEFVYEILNLSDYTEDLHREIVNEGEQLLRSANGYTHQLDRLRYLKQKYLLLNATLDLNDVIEQRVVWSRISQLAVALLELARIVVWDHVTSEIDRDIPCPVFIVGMGKLGGDELNYSSDVDLVFVLKENVSDEEEKLAQKWAELFRSAIGDRMGRGEIFRVDLRLRPFGTQGPLLNRLSAIKNYYRNYAEIWEHMALIRSVCLGASESQEKEWFDLRNEIVFRKSRSALAIDKLLKMRESMEKHSEEDNLKTGSGGIRDIEFIAQIAQLMSGKKHSSLQVSGTLEALRSLAMTKLLPETIVIELSEAYIFLRQVEHRCQISGGLQTHSLPQSEDLKAIIAASLHMKTVSSLESKISYVRTVVRQHYSDMFQQEEPAVVEYSPGVVRWMTEIEGSSGYLRALQENKDSLRRVEEVAEHCPILIPELKQLVSVTDQVISGEVLEPTPYQKRFSQIDKQDIREMALAFRRGRCLAALRGVLVDPVGLGDELTLLYDQMLDRLYDWLGGKFSVIALGSYASGEISLGSDADLVLIANGDSFEAEQKGQEFLKIVSSLKIFGAPVEIDLRLRPEGRNGRVVPTLDGFGSYRRRFMETWEKFACGRARLVVGDKNVLKEFSVAAYGDTLTLDELAELKKMKQRIDHERVNQTVRLRHLKLGPGGINDIIWATQLYLMRHPWVQKECGLDVPSRLKALVNAQFLTVLEAEMLEEAWKFFAELRMRIYLLGATDDLVPENPDKLNIISDAMNLGDANSVLAQHERYRTEVREFFDQIWQRLVQ